MQEPVLPGPQNVRHYDKWRLVTYLFNLNHTWLEPDKLKWQSPYIKRRVLWMEWRIRQLKIHELIGKKNGTA